MQKYILALFIFYYFSFTATAQDFWQPPEGPTGADVTSILRTSDGRLYLGTFTTGLFRSDNNGQSWRSINSGVNGYQINDITVDADGNLYAAVESSGIFISKNRGESWLEFSSMIRNETIQSILVQADGSILIAVRGQGIYKSSDSGVTWDYSGLKGKIMQKIKKSPTGDLFAAGNDGVYRFNAATEIWERKSEGIPSITVKTLAFSKDGVIYCGTYGAGVLRSDDNGETWIPKLNGFQNYIMGWIEKLVFDADGTLWAAVAHDDFGGLYFTEDGGENWQEISVPISAKKFLSLLIHGDDMFIGVYKYGIYHATRPFLEWTPQTSGFWFYKSNCLASDSHGRIFAGTAGGGIFQSDDNHSWMEKNFGLGAYSINALHRSRGDTLYASFFPGLVRSVDGGNLWTLQVNGLSNLNIHCFAHDSQGAVYIGNNHGLHSSKNAGESWEAVNSLLENHQVHSVFINGSEFYLGTQTGTVLNSSNGGASWDDISGNLPSQQITCIVQYSGQIYTSARTAGVFCLNEKSDWLDVSYNLPSLVINVLLVHANKLYTGTEKGMFVLEGQNWLPLNSGLWDTNIHDRHIDDAGFFWAATDIGVAKSASKVVNVTSESLTNLPSSIEFYPARPNPFNAATRLECYIPKTAFVTVEIFSITGRLVETLVSKQLAAGTHRFTWKAGKNTSGIYLVRMQVDNELYISKMTLQK